MIKQEEKVRDKATHLKIPHGHSRPNGAQRTPIRPFLRKIEEEAREERI